jgi:transcriptional antiterminator
MLDAKLADLLEGLSESEYVPSQALAGHCGISDRTVRTRVQELREELERNGAISAALWLPSGGAGQTEVPDLAEG